MMRKLILLTVLLSISACAVAQSPAPAPVTNPPPPVAAPPPAPAPVPAAQQPPPVTTPVFPIIIYGPADGDKHGPVLATLAADGTATGDLAALAGMMSARRGNALPEDVLIWTVVATLRAQQPTGPIATAAPTIGSAKKQ